MNLAEAQAKVGATLKGDDAGIEALISIASEMNQGAKNAVEDARNARGPLSGLGSIAVRYACQGASIRETQENLIKLAEKL